MATKPLRRIRIVGNIAYVPLTQGYEAIIDASDAHMASQFTWRASVRSRQVYAVTSISDKSGKQRALYLHRAIANAQDGLDVDHISGNGLDNRSVNLRVATRSQNAQNQRRRSDNRSGYKGVHAHNGKWRAMIYLKGKGYSLGLHDTAEDAYEAYKAASKEMHKSFGRAS